ncbi:MAG: 7-cyano-7-deazaguanine synthase [Candidatus Baldrarchaeia archaeon]
MQKTCQICLLDETYKEFPIDVEGGLRYKIGSIKINSTGLCNICEQYQKDKAEFLHLRNIAKENLQKTLYDTKSSDYDALVALSGGKDSTTTLILAKEKYKLNVLAFTIDNGFKNKETRENIENVVDELGVEHVTFKIPKTISRKVFSLSIKIGDPCTICQRLINPPIMAKMQLKNGIKTRILGIDLAQTYHQYYKPIKYWKNVLGIGNPFIYSIKQANPKIYEERSKKYIQEILNDVKVEYRAKIERELHKIMKIIRKYWLKEKEIEEFVKNNVTIHLHAIEISNRNTQEKILEKYGFKFPKISKTFATDCKVSAFAHSIHTKKMEKVLLSQEIRVGLLTKEEALEKLNRKPAINELKQLLKELKIEKLENIRKSSKFYEIYDKNIIQQVTTK